MPVRHLWAALGDLPRISMEGPNSTTMSGDESGHHVDEEGPASEDEEMPSLGALEEDDEEIQEQCGVGSVRSGSCNVPASEDNRARGGRAFPPLA